MIDIETIPTFELKEDLAESIGDIELCERAIKAGVTTYGKNESVQNRLDANKRIKQKIETELKKRGEL
jgi:hypothetical protein